ncbi:MAG: nucleotidyl transferase AbiEii/AbiGii toxin family protein [Agriterribacter sp.]
MLQYGAIEPRTLDVLNELMQVPELNHFYLVGGTALALYFGHRKSIDVDLFSNTDFSQTDLIDSVQKKFSGFVYRNIPNPIGVFGFIDNIKVDFVKHHLHPLIQPLVIENGIRMCSVPDIIAMKIAAIMKRGVKKDFWDIALLLQHYSIQNCIDFYTQKYPGQQLLISVPMALTYFIDAEESEDPIALNGQTWDAVKKFIQEKVNDYLK